MSDKDWQVVSALDGRRLKDAGLETHLQSVHYGELTIASASEASSDSNGAEYGIDFDTGNLVHIDAVSQISMLYMLDAGGETDEAAVKAIGSALGIELCHKQDKNGNPYWWRVAAYPKPKRCSYSPSVDQFESSIYSASCPADDPHQNPWIDAYGAGDEAETAYWNTQ